MSNKNTRFLSVDFLRVASLFMIILYHFNVEMITKRGWGDMIGWHGNNIIDLGQMGVGIFMIISGFSLSGNSKISALAFFKKRLLRIYPQFYICYAVCLVILIVCNGGVSFSAKPSYFLYTLLGMDGYLHYKQDNFYITGEWFLGAILSLYLVFPVIDICTRNKPIIALLVAVILLSVNHYFYNLLYQISEWNNLITMGFLFLFGSAFRYLSHNTKPHIIIAITAIPVCYLIFMFKSVPLATQVLVPMVLFTTTVSSFLLFQINDKKMLLIGYISEISFSAFLVHHVLISVITGNNKINTGTQSNYLLLAICLVATIAFGHLCNKFNKLIVTSPQNK